MKILRYLCFVVLAVALIAGAAMATAKWFNLFNDTYKPKPDTQLAKPNARSATRSLTAPGVGTLMASCLRARNWTQVR